MSHIRYYTVLLWIVTVAQLSMRTWFGTFSTPGVRMQACGLLYPLPVGQTMWFGMPNVWSPKAELVEQSIENNETEKYNNA